MKFTRRETFAVAAGFVAFGVAGLRPTTASATEEDAMKAVMEFAGGEPQAGRISLTAPEIAENGNTVPVTVSVESPMTDADHVQSVVLYADGNPNPFV
nr:thiosulfate oxidation carrier protein SoxY [Rhizobiaceae bacterium]